MTDAQTQASVLLSRKKSTGLALLLCLVFGPLGMFYTTARGAIILICAAIALAIPTSGFASLAAIPISWIWGPVAASKHNQKIEREVGALSETATE